MEDFFEKFSKNKLLHLVSIVGLIYSWKVCSNNTWSLEGFVYASLIIIGMVIMAHLSAKYSDY